jgi:hypothetical protein
MRTKNTYYLATNLKKPVQILDVNGDTVRIRDQSQSKTDRPPDRWVLRSLLITQAERDKKLARIEHHKKAAERFRKQNSNGR